MLFHAPGETTGGRTKGREQAGKSTDRPNLVFGGDVHVVWEFCRYFDVEPRIIPLQRGKSQLNSIAGDVGRDVSLGGAEAALRNAVRQLAASYRRPSRRSTASRSG